MQIILELCFLWALKLMILKSFHSKHDLVCEAESVVMRFRVMKLQVKYEVVRHPPVQQNPLVQANSPVLTVLLASPPRGWKPS